MKAAVITLFVIICLAFILSYLRTGRSLLDHISGPYSYLAIAAFLLVTFFSLNLILNGEWW
jgi:hypothetical protein